MIKSRAMLRLAMVSALVLCCTSLPVPDPSPALDDRPEIIEIIAPAQAAQETLDSLNFGEPNAETSDRSKRTIGILRQLFPNLSQIVDQKIQAIVSFLIRTVGRTLLTGALGGGGNNGGTSGGSDSGNKVSIALPSFDSDEDEEDDEDTDDNNNDKTTTTTFLPSIDSRIKEDNTTAVDSSQEVQASKFEDSSSIESTVTTTANTLSINEVHPEETINNNSSSSTTDNETSSTESLSSSTLTSDSSLFTTLESVTTTVQDTSTIVSPVTAADNNDSENQLAGAESQHNEVRVQFTDDASQKDAAEGDQEIAASDTDGLALDDIDSPDETRDKRSGFGGGDSGSGSSGGGSGNFLFDIIRRPAENVARAAGQAFRILTGTDSIGLGITATHTAVRDIDNTNKLVAGSGGTEQNDEATNATDDSDGTGKAESAYGEGIPGPVTRLFIIANRGIANLIQDLILRLAHTSERIVNFKARLITSII